MLPRPYYHVLRGGNVDDGGLPRVGVRHPYCYREAVCRAAKGDWQGPAEEQEQRRGSILISCCREYVRKDWGVHWWVLKVTHCRLLFVQRGTGSGRGLRRRRDKCGLHLYTPV